MTAKLTEYSHCPDLLEFEGDGFQVEGPDKDGELELCFEYESYGTFGSSFADEKSIWLSPEDALALAEFITKRFKKEEN